MGPIVKIHKEKDKKDIDYQPDLMKLSKAGLILWMYFMRYDPDEVVQVHYKELEERGKINKQEYIKGFKNLEENCFIIQQAKTALKREYDFYPAPQVKKAPQLNKQNYKITYIAKKEVESETLKNSKQTIEKFGF